MGNEMYKDDELDKSDELLDLVSVVCEPVEENLLENQVQLLEHPVPVDESYKLEVEDVALLKGDQAWDSRKTVQDEVALEVAELNFLQLIVDEITFLLLVILIEVLLQVGSVVVGLNISRWWERDEGEKYADGEGDIDKHLECSQLVGNMREHKTKM